jgi:hypothetical protein
MENITYHSHSVKKPLPGKSPSFSIGDCVKMSDNPFAMVVVAIHPQVKKIGRKFVENVTCYELKRLGDDNGFPYYAYEEIAFCALTRAN